MLAQKNDKRTAIEEFASDGMTLNQIASALGCSYESVRRIVGRAGIPVLSEGHRDLRQIVNDMTPLNAVEFLLDLIQEAIPTYQKDHPVDHLGLNFGPQERIILLHLAANPDRTYSKESIYSAMYAHVPGGSETEIQIVAVLIRKIRIKLTRTSICILNKPGVGYKVVDPDGLLRPRKLPNTTFRPEPLYDLSASRKYG